MAELAAITPVDGISEPQMAFITPAYCQRQAGCQMIGHSRWLVRQRYAASRRTDI